MPQEPASASSTTQPGCKGTAASHHTQPGCKGNGASPNTQPGCTGASSPRLALRGPSILKGPASFERPFASASQAEGPAGLSYVRSRHAFHLTRAQ